MCVPGELVDEEHPLQYKPLDHLDSLISIIPMIMGQKWTLSSKPTMVCDQYILG